MVEPISLALISGAAGLGMALGRLTKRESDEYESLPPSFNFGPTMEPVEPANLQFFAVEDIVNPAEIVDQAKNGAQVFVSIKKLLGKADKIYRFIHRLREATEAHDLQIHQISKDLLLVNSKSQTIQVKTLKRMANAELDDKLLHKSIAGY